MKTICFDRLIISDTPHWLWQVHENQSYLGRILLRLKRPLTESLAHLEDQEWSELHRELKRYEGFIRATFSPDRMNYAQLGNEYPQLHVHAVPRYATQRCWRGRIFSDRNWGSDWAPTPEPAPISIEEVYEFAAWLASTLSEFESGHE